MKKKKITKVIIAVIAVVLVAAAAILITGFLRSRKTETMVQQQNYVASKLLELGDYEQGRILAAQSEQIKENDISRQLLVLAAGFQSDYETGIRYAEGYLSQKSDARLAEAKEVKNAKLMWPVRIAGAGKSVTPGGAVEICRILGKEECLRRMAVGIEKLSNR